VKNMKNENLEIIKDKINELIKGYPGPSKPLIIKHFQPAFDASERMAAEIENLKTIIKSCEIGEKGMREEIADYRGKIARLKAELESYQKIINLCDYCIKEYPECDAPKEIEFSGADGIIKCSAFKDGRNLWKTIRDLKAELEQRPGIIYCKECYKRGLVQCPMWDYSINKTFDERVSQTDDDFYCANGVKKESEGKR